MDPEVWESNISKSGTGGAFVYSDGSLLEERETSAEVPSS